MNRFILILSLLLVPTLLLAQGQLDAMGSYFLELAVSAAVLLIGVFILVVYFIIRKKNLATILYVFGGAYVIYGIKTLVSSEGFLIIMIPGIIYLLFGILSLTLPFMRKPL